MDNSVRELLEAAKENAAAARVAMEAMEAALLGPVTSGELSACVLNGKKLEGRTIHGDAEELSSECRKLRETAERVLKNL